MLSVLRSDAGKYTCIRANKAGLIEVQAYLNILGKLIKIFSILSKR